MVKFIRGWEITKKLDKKQNAYVRHFSGSKVICMHDYVKPCIRFHEGFTRLDVVMHPIYF